MCLCQKEQVGGGVTLDASGNAVFNGIVCNGVMFGRNDTGPNTFSGTLGTIQHPIGWTISVKKTISSTFTSGAYHNIITFGTPTTTAFDNLSNGVWMFGVTCNNDASDLGDISYIELSYEALTGATAINGELASLMHRMQGPGIFGLSYPTLIIRTTGNKTTRINPRFYISLNTANSPTMVFNMWATKIA